MVTYIIHVSINNVVEIRDDLFTSYVCREPSCAGIGFFYHPRQLTPELIKLMATSPRWPICVTKSSSEVFRIYVDGP